MSRNCAKVIQVIETVTVIGAGTNNDPSRHLIEYWDFEGNKLAEYDSIKWTNERRF